MCPRPMSFGEDGMARITPAIGMLASSGRWIHRNRYLVILIWLIAFAATLPFAPRVQEKLLPGGFSNEDYPSVKARELLRDRFGVIQVGLILVVSHDTLRPNSPDFVADVLRISDQLSTHADVLAVRSYLSDPGMLSDDGDLGLIQADLGLDIEDSLDATYSITTSLDTGDLDVVITGAPPLYRDLVVASGADFRRGEVVAFPVATIALLIVFGTVVAASMPVIVGGIAVTVGLGIIYFVADLREMSLLSFNVVTLLGIGMGIDYSLFYVNRFKEELAGGLSVADAIAATHPQAGMAILFSGVTSIIGMSSLLLFDLNVLDSIGIGAVVVIAIALLAAQTLMPAVLSIIGHRIDRFRVIPIVSSNNRIWARMAEGVMRRPWLFLVPTVIALLALVTPLQDIRMGVADATILPAEYESRRGFDLLQERFGWEVSTELIVAYTFDGDPFAPARLNELYAFGQALERLPNVNEVRSIVNLRPTLGAEDYRNLYAHPESIYDGEALRLLNDSVRDGVVLFYVSSEIHPFSSEAFTLVRDVQSFRLPSDSDVLVDGSSASVDDLVSSLYGRFPLVAGLVILLTFASLMMLFRSVLIPLKAVALNVLSILASFGALVWVFQQGHLSGVLDFEPLGVTEATTPIVLFAILFGLSMDYEIFLLSRINEAYRSTGSNRESVKQGLQKSGMIITGAGSILVIVGVSFVLAEVVTVKAVGFGLALAIFVDVTIVRILIAPALMRIFGKWNWWFPSWADRTFARINRP